jgi:predicted phosphate transport protein (TIGR00153 family)
MPTLLARLLPRETTFFHRFTEVTANIEAGARALVDLLENYRDVERKVAHIKDLEHRGDQMTHDLMTRLNQTFITPFDREDIHELASKLDDVLDLIDAVAGRLIIYRIAAPRPGAADLAHTLLKATGEVHAAVSQLEKQDRILDHCIEINRLENEGDVKVRAAVARLFEEEKNPVEIIKWKELFEVLEIATDKCEDVANVLETVVLKSGG